MKQCPDCNGTGGEWLTTFVGFVLPYFDECAKCNGVGEISDEASNNS